VYCDVDFMPHRGGRGKCVERQLWHVFTIVFIVTVVVSPIFEFGFFAVRAGNRWGVFTFLGGWASACGGGM
jgi:hypothetical protein